MAMEMKIKTATYPTPDLNVAAFLLENGFQIMDAKRCNGKVIFIFSDPGKSADEVARSYFNGAQVVAVRFADRLRNLKTVVMRGWGG